MKDSFGWKLIVAGILLLSLEIYCLVPLASFEEFVRRQYYDIGRVLSYPAIIIALLLAVSVILIGILYLLKNKADPK